MLTYPETVEYKAAYVASKSRRLADGRFEAVAAFFFGGVRRNQKTAIGKTRHEAFRLARAALK